MISDPELAAAVDGRAHWQPAGDSAAVYVPPGAAVIVRVQRAARPVKREVYMASVIRDGQASYTRPCFTAEEAVRYAERVRDS